MVEEQRIELFVTEAESLVLEALAQAEVPHSQRAQALLAVDAGSTIEQAAKVANLRVTQVRFWIGRFKNDRLTVFPESLIEEIESFLQGATKDDSVAKPKKKKEKVKMSKKKPVADSKGGKQKNQKKQKKGKKKKAATVKSKKTKKEKKAEKAKKANQKKKGTKKSGKKNK